MNTDLENFARKHLKEQLAKCTEKEQNLFKQMYANSQPANLGVDINMVVDEMTVDKLDWAMQQVSRTLEKAND